MVQRGVVGKGFWWETGMNNSFFLKKNNDDVITK